jgi:hypothetical protein
MKQVIVALLSSKKFITSLMGVATAIGVQIGIPEVEIEELMAILSPLLVYIGAQGFADMGRAKAESAVPVRPSTESEKSQ